MTALIVPLAALVVGLILGSFGNVAVYRWPRRMTVTAPPGSACGACGAPIRPADNIPIVSWLLLRGKCRDCGAPIHWRYPVVEATTAALFAGIAAVHGWTWILPALLVVAWSAVVATAIDLEFRIIPNRMTYPLAPLVLVLVIGAAALDNAWDSALWAVGAGIAIPLAMFLLSEGFRLLRGKAGIGMGDIKWAPALAMTLGYLGPLHLVVWFYATIFSAGFVAIALILARRAKLATRIPYGPYLALGWILAVLAGGPLTDGLRSYLGL